MKLRSAILKQHGFSTPLHQEPLQNCNLMARTPHPNLLGGGTVCSFFEGRPYLNIDIDEIFDPYRLMISQFEIPLQWSFPVILM